MFGAVGDSLTPIRILPRGIELIWQMLLAMQPKKEAAEEKTPSPAKTEKKARLSIIPK